MVLHTYKHTHPQEWCLGMLFKNAVKNGLMLCLLLSSLLFTAIFFLAVHVDRRDLAHSSQLLTPYVCRIHIYFLLS